MAINEYHKKYGTLKDLTIYNVKMVYQINTCMSFT